MESGAAVVKRIIRAHANTNDSKYLEERNV